MSAPRQQAPLRALAPLALMGAIFYFSSQHADPDQAWWTVVARKLGHVGGYAALTALWTWALAGTMRRPVLIAAAISLAYACSDEYHQSFVDTRHGSPVDVAVDMLGIALASLALARAKPQLPHQVGRATCRNKGPDGSEVARPRSSLARSP